MLWQEELGLNIESGIWGAEVLITNSKRKHGIGSEFRVELEIRLLNKAGAQKV